MNKCCASYSNNCDGKIERYKVNSKKDDSIYPNRYWGVSDYCEKHLKEDKENGYILTKVNNDTELITL